MQGIEKLHGLAVHVVTRISGETKTAHGTRNLVLTGSRGTSFRTIGSQNQKSQRNESIFTMSSFEECACAIRTLPASKPTTTQHDDCDDLEHDASQVPSAVL